MTRKRGQWRITSSMREGEVWLLWELANELKTTRASVIRAMLRYTLEMKADFKNWLKVQETLKGYKGSEF